MIHPVLASVPAGELSAAQSAHYQIDDQIRSALSGLTIDQKKAALAKILNVAAGKEKD